MGGTVAWADSLLVRPTSQPTLTRALSIISLTHGAASLATRSPRDERRSLVGSLPRGAISSGPSSPPQQTRAESLRAPQRRGPGTSPGSVPLNAPPRHYKTAAPRS
jgi:hypothetical protein